MSLLNDVYYNFKWFLCGDAAVPPQYRLDDPEALRRHRERFRNFDAEIEATLGLDEQSILEREARQDRERRRHWVRDRLWYNGPHKDCCQKCLQAGYVMGLRRAGRLDLLAEYPKIIETHEELVTDGLIARDPI